MNEMKCVITEVYDEKDADKEVEITNNSYFGGNGILCECVMCKGQGYARYESMINRYGVVMGIKCPCGGALKKVQMK